MGNDKDLVAKSGEPGSKNHRVKTEKVVAPNQKSSDIQSQAEDHEASQARKFGTFAGVFTPCLLTILGVIMYLREGWVVGNAGLLGALLIILLSFGITLATIHKALTSNNSEPIKKFKRKKKFKRYSRPIPGDRIQMDTCKIAPGIYQYTAIDDCSRWRVLEIYKRRTAANTMSFLDLVIKQFPFSIQRIQTDRGREFFAVKVQEKLMSLGIKFRPNKPASPHLNGKVERSQKTDLEEFYATVDLSELAAWQFFYNWQRPHGSLSGKPPSQIVAELSDKTPLWDEAASSYDIKKERIQEPNYQTDLLLRKLKGSM